VKPLPVMVMMVLPVVGPVFGETPVTTGWGMSRTFRLRVEMGCAGNLAYLNTRKRRSN
jgi:hypothetical protein